MNENGLLFQGRSKVVPPSLVYRRKGVEISFGYRSHTLIQEAAKKRLRIVQ